MLLANKHIRQQRQKGSCQGLGFDLGILGRSIEQILGFLPAGLNETALFSCEAHNRKGLTASSPGQVNVKGKHQRDARFTCCLRVSRQELSSSPPSQRTLCVR